MIRRITSFAILLLAWTLSSGAQQHETSGIVLSTDAAHQSLTISCAAIPGYMDAMEMPFTVNDEKTLTALKPGTAVSFTMVQRDGQFYAERIQIEPAANLESEPLQAGQLSVLHNALSPGSAAKQVRDGERVPDFQLTDQVAKTVRLSQFQGKAVALTFGYSRCPNPNYCFRLSDNLSRVQKRFHDRAGRDFVLLTINIDPEHDQGAALTKYAETWNANPKVWHFLTGSVADIHRIAEMFGMDFWNSEGFVIHSLHTVVIDRSGRLAANLEGNSFTAQQLGDLLQTVMDRK